MTNRFQLVHKIAGHGTLLFLVFFAVDSFAQQFYIVKKQTDTIAFHTRIDSNGFQVDSRSLPASGRFPKIESLTLEDADLQLSFALPGESQKYSPDVVKIIGILDSDHQMILPISYKLLTKDPAGNQKSLKKGNVIWRDVSEDVIRANQDYSLIIERGIAGTVDCAADRPVFQQKEQWPHFAAAGVGIVSIAVGQVYNAQKNQAYDNYKTTWVEGKDESDGGAFLSDAQESEKQAKIWTYTGIAILSADAILYFYRWATIRHKQANWDEFCQPEQKVSINIKSGGGYGGLTDASIGISIQF